MKEHSQLVGSRQGEASCSGTPRHSTSNLFGCNIPLVFPSQNMFKRATTVIIIITNATTYADIYYIYD